MALSPFEAHPKYQKWSSYKKLADQIEKRIEEGKIIVENPRAKLVTRQMTEEERKKYFS